MFFKKNQKSKDYLKALIPGNNKYFMSIFVFVT